MGNKRLVIYSVNCIEISLLNIHRVVRAGHREYHGLLFDGTLFQRNSIGNRAFVTGVPVLRAVLSVSRTISTSRALTLSPNTFNSCIASSNAFTQSENVVLCAL